MTRCNRLKVGTILPDRDVFKLIALVQRHVCLWNSNSKDYTNKPYRNNAWVDICNQFGGLYHERDLRAKWGNLRIQYRTNVQKAALFGGTDSRVWKFFKPMLFLDHRDHSETMADASSMDTRDANISASGMKTVQSNPVQSIIEPASLATQMSPAASFIKKDIDVPIYDEALSVNNTNNSNLGQIDEEVLPVNNSNADPNFAFTNYLYAELKQLSENNAKELRKQMLHLLIHFEN